MSKGKWGNAINRVVGEVTHSMVCLTPFVPWALSHRKHHLHHNHLERDYSHQWYVREELDDLHPAIQLAHSTRMLFLPVLYFVYLFLGVPDGGHVLFYGRMWEGHSLKEKLDGALSVAVSCATAGTLWHNMGTADFAVVCMGPWVVLRSGAVPLVAFGIASTLVAELLLLFSVARSAFGCLWSRTCSITPTTANCTPSECHAI